MSMEWVEGEPLHTIISEAGKRRPIPAEMAVRIIADAAAGLHAAHELRDEQGQLRGLVHRDVSPHNILLGTNGVVKLVDFGVAKALGRLAEATRSGQLKGKFGYMSPEQARGKRVDRRSDVFSLGIVLFELTTNRRLFRGENDVDTLRLVLAGRVPRPSSIELDYPKRLEQIVMRALERDVERRYQTAAEFRQDLENYLKEERVVVPRSGVAGLLKRVMGARIEQRRRAVRRAVKALDGAREVGSALISNDPAFYGSHEVLDSSDELSEGSGSGQLSYSPQGIGGLSDVGSAPSDPSFPPATPSLDSNLRSGRRAAPAFLGQKLTYILLVIIAALLGVIMMLLVRGRGP
jgi:serine/threonine-protein kinase